MNSRVGTKLKQNAQKKICQLCVCVYIRVQMCLWVHCMCEQSHRLTRDIFLSPSQPCILRQILSMNQKILLCKSIDLY